MKRIIKIMMICQLALCLVAGPGLCFLFEIKPVDTKQIHQLKDDQLIDTYINAMIELEAVDKFFSNSGLKPNEYDQYKKLLRYRTDLILEIESRKLAVPRIK